MPLRVLEAIKKAGFIPDENSSKLASPEEKRGRIFFRNDKARANLFAAKGGPLEHASVFGARVPDDFRGSRIQLLKELEQAFEKHGAHVGVEVFADKTGTHFHVRFHSPVPEAEKQKWYGKT